ncbi:hypothetical protein [Olleya sp. YS]|uniref:hypothetical protein n=1 Tax=Olleya sp. YS TaxID=3028318 RepID=UPI0024341B17|nr:hypothetical protein [Olleya sp. YS]WGD35285.1 hypothetical protein Ollyesu_02480 [Olleya sp. YS]
MTELINNLINHHFCIRGKTKEEILECLNIEFQEQIIFDADFDWEFLSAENVENKKRFILFDSINDWAYLRWNIWDFEVTKKLVSKISKELNTEVNYFFIDPWIFTLRWIIAKNGKVTRIYYEYQDVIIEQSGELELEKEIRKKIKKRDGENEFWEDKYWDLYEKMNPPITILNEKTEVSAVIGELK